MPAAEKEIRSIFRTLNDGTDKHQHDYAPVYATIEWLAARTIDSVFEIGIDKGYSLLAWRQVFPYADILGIDTDPKVTRPDILSDPRIHIETGDVRTYNLLSSFDLIIDDCLHDLDTISVAWYRFHQHFRVAYVIEDVRPEIMMQVYELVTSTLPDAQVILWKTSNYRGDASFTHSDSHCVIVRR
jgi:trans-aconitate methyltransferase